jgi:hypothetical protein
MSGPYLEPTHPNLDKVVGMLDAIALGLLDRTDRAWVVPSYLTAEPDGRVRSGVKVVGDGPILWAVVSLRELIASRDRSKPPR